MLGNAVGYLLLGFAATAAGIGIGNVGLIILQGLTVARLSIIMIAFGFAMYAGFFGYYIRKRVAGQVLDIDYDISAGLRGGQGGLPTPVVGLALQGQSVKNCGPPTTRQTRYALRAPFSSFAT